MSKSKKKWIAALAVPALAVTGVGVASAQTAETPDDTDGSTTEESNEGRRGRRGGRALGAMAEAIGIEASELKDAVQSGQTVADVATANGADIDQVIADIVADAQTRADEAGRENFDAAELTERLTAAANGEVDFSNKGRRGGGLRGSSEAVQELLGLERDEIRSALSDGGTLADVAAGQGVSLEELVSTIVDDVEDRLSESDNGLPEDFDSTALAERVETKVTTEREPGERRGPRGPGGPPADAESTTA